MSQSHSSLPNFDQLPNSAHVRLPVVMALWGCATSTVWHWSKLGKIPKPRKLSSRVTAWNVGELRAALAGKS